MKQVVTDKFHEMKGSGARRLSHCLTGYIGHSEKSIQRVLSESQLNQKLNVRFSNKAPIIPITAKRPMERLQIDLVDMTKHPDWYKGQTYKYILTLLDVYSRYVWLRPLAKKSSNHVKRELELIFSTYGFPYIIQHDKGSEFSGDVKLFLQAHKIKTIVSSPFHPQSQGKVERSHRSLKSMVKYDMLHNKHLHWAKNLPEYQKNMNDSPKEVLGWLTPFTAYFGRVKNPHFGTNPSSKQIESKVIKATNHVNNRTVRASERKLCVPKYLIGDKILIKLSKKSSRVSGKRFIVEGEVLRQSNKTYRYKCRYKDDGHTVEQWVPITNIVADTLSAQRKREHLSKQKKIVAKSNNHVPNKNLKNIMKMTHKGQVQNLRNEFGLDILFDPIGDGNCLFEALAFQLEFLNYDITGLQLRGAAVRYLSAHEFLGHQTEISWHASLHLETPSQYLDRMSCLGVYGDQIVLQSIAEMYNLQILIISTINGGTNIITPSGNNTFLESEPYVVLGHFAETDGSHYVALIHHTEDIHNIVLNSQQIEMPTAHDAITSTNTTHVQDSNETVIGTTKLNDLNISKVTPNVETKESNTTHETNTCNTESKSFVKVTAKSIASGEKMLPYLPHEIWMKIINYTLTNCNLLQYQRLCLVSVLFYQITTSYAKPEQPQIYINPCNQKALKINEKDFISVVYTNAVLRKTGKSSGLSLRLKSFLTGINNWYNSVLYLVPVAYGWFKVVKVLWVSKAKK